MWFPVLVEVSLREGIADPEGATVQRALPALGFTGVEGVRVGKAIRFRIEAPDEAQARALVDDLCQRLLTNPVIEDAAVTMSQGEGDEGDGDPLSGASAPGVEGTTEGR